VHLFTLDELERGGEQKRALATLKLPVFQPAIVDFLSQEAFVIFKIESGDAEILRCDGNAIVSLSKVLLADLQ
jgi:hypothetical protein